MKNITKTLFLLCAVVALTSSCKKDDDKTKTDFLQDRSCWKTTKVETRDTSSEPFVDATIDFLGTQACDLDDCTVFAKGGAYSVTEGDTKCNPASPDVIDSGTWSLSADEQILTIIASGSNSAAKVETLTSDRLVLSGQYEDGEIRVTYQ